MPRTPPPSPENFNIFRNPPLKSCLVRTWVHNVSSFYFLRLKNNWVISHYLYAWYRGLSNALDFFKSNSIEDAI